MVEDTVVKMQTLSGQAEAEKDAFHPLWKSSGVSASSSASAAGGDI